MYRLLLFTVFLIFQLTINGQGLRLTHMRVGIDPIWTPLYFVNNLYVYQYFNWYKNWEGYFEVIGPYRLSAVLEGGMTEASIYKNLFCTKGGYVRLGCNFDLSEPHGNYEFDLGWRVGYSRFTYILDSAAQNENSGYLSNSAYWAEILLEYKIRLFPKHPHLKHFMLAASLRAKMAPTLVNNPNDISLKYLPGFGKVNIIYPAFQVHLLYTFQLSKSTMHKSHRLNNTLEIFEDKHHIKKIKRFKRDSDDVERD